MTMTPEAKSRLSKTIRALRTRLLEDFKSSNESTFKYSIRRIEQANLSEADATRRGRVEAWIAEQIRGEAGKELKRTSEEFHRDLEKQAAYTLLNRLLILRLMEAAGLHSGDLVSKGWGSDVFRNLRFFALEIAQNDDTEGLSFWLQMTFDEFAIEMPGLYGDAGVSDCIPVRAQTFRVVIEAFADPLLISCWNDDMALGWVYQFWNDPDRELLDAKIHNGNKIEPNEIASKTQLFTERYMVDWLLQNSLGRIWFSICVKQGWTPLVVSTGTLDNLDQRRIEWRKKRDSGEIEPTQCMPFDTELERRWLYFVAGTDRCEVEQALGSIRDIKILDPAVGSGHFLIIAFDLLFGLYEEESIQRGLSQNVQWSVQSIVESILENNLHGIDLDPRAVQLAAAALWLKAKSKCVNARPARLNLVASSLGIANLPENDPALIDFRTSVESEVGIPVGLTDKIIDALRGADHLGSLLKFDETVTSAIDHYQLRAADEGNSTQLEMYDGSARQQHIPIAKEIATKSLIALVENFVAQHAAADDLGMRVHGEQLAAGIRFLSLTKSNTYDLVVGNPPYQDTSSISSMSSEIQLYGIAKNDLYSMFMWRAFELLVPHGWCALLTIRNWMFLPDFKEFREALIEQHHLAAVCDLDRGAFEEIAAGPGGIGVAIAIWQRGIRSTESTVFQRPSKIHSVAHDLQEKIASTLVQERIYVRATEKFGEIQGSPLVYWWTNDFFRNYTNTAKLGEIAPVRTGMSTSNNSRFIRCVWEIAISEDSVNTDLRVLNWAYTIMGAKSQQWIDQPDYVVSWRNSGLEMKVHQEIKYGSVSRRIQSQDRYFTKGIAFTCIGNDFTARVHRFPGIFGQAGSSVFPKDIPNVLCLMNRTSSKEVVRSLNPTVNFQVSDIERIPLDNVEGAEKIYNKLINAFNEHEQHRETSTEFEMPGKSRWKYASAWAQNAVDRSSSEPMPEFLENFESESISDHVSYAIGMSLGRFGKGGTVLPNGILYLDQSLQENDHQDSMGHEATLQLHSAWTKYRNHYNVKKDLRSWLANDFFTNFHKKIYKNRPIYWPLSSRNKTFVAFVSIHRWNANTLRHILADHVRSGTLLRLEGELEDLRANRDDRDTDKRFTKVKDWKDEIDEFIEMLSDCSEKGPPPTDKDCPQRSHDALYEPNLDDGVMVNCSALWPLLEPQWKDPKKWWKQIALANPRGNKDFDWSQTAMRYWPTRVDEKSQSDPSLAVAHGCFWKYHPARAWVWELRLQDEIAPDFRIEEKAYRGDEGDPMHRKNYLHDCPSEGIEAIEKEVHRRRKSAKGKILSELTIIETGLWSAEPEACWDMETRIIKKQEHGFRLIAPDEKEARAKLIKNTPQKLTGRNTLLRNRGGDTEYLAGWEDAVDNS